MPDLTPKKPEKDTTETSPAAEKSPLETNLPHWITKKYLKAFVDKAFKGLYNLYVYTLVK